VARQEAHGRCKLQDAARVGGPSGCVLLWGPDISTGRVIEPYSAGIQALSSSLLLQTGGQLPSNHRVPKGARHRIRFPPQPPSPPVIVVGSLSPRAEANNC
jgi:hypothetical protein